MLAERLADQARRTEELRAQATNLEMLDTLLAALTDTDGVQGAFERISAIAHKVVSHDALALPVFLPGGKQARRYAATGLGTTLEIIDLPEEFLDPAWDHDLIDDATAIPGAHNARVASLGFLSALRVPIRLDGKNAAALIFLSKTRAAFKERDVPVARRIADRLTVTLARDN